MEGRSGGLQGVMRDRGGDEIVTSITNVNLVTLRGLLRGGRIALKRGKCYLTVRYKVWNVR